MDDPALVLCYYSKDYDLTIHKFGLHERVCSCGKEYVPEREESEYRSFGFGKRIRPNKKD